MVHEEYKGIKLSTTMRVTYMVGQRTDCAACPLRTLEGCNLIRRDIDCAKVRILSASIERVEDDE